MDEPQVLGRASAGVGYQEGLIHALRHVLEHERESVAAWQREPTPCVLIEDLQALLAHVEEHGELPIARTAIAEFEADR